MRIEGQDSTSRIFGTYDYTQMAQPSVDSIQEIAYQTSNYAAEFGQAGFVVINMTMKSGTNQYHGSGYEYFVNEDLNAGDPFSISGGCRVALARQWGWRQVPAEQPPQRFRRNPGRSHCTSPRSTTAITRHSSSSAMSSTWRPHVLLQRHGAHAGLSEGQFLRDLAEWKLQPLRPSTGFRLRRWVLRAFKWTPTASQCSRMRSTIPPRAACYLRRPCGQGYANPFPNNIDSATRFDPVSVKIQALITSLGAAAQNANLTNNYTGIIAGGRYSAIPSIKIDHNVDAKDKLSFYYSENNTAEPDFLSPGERGRPADRDRRISRHFHSHLYGASELRPHPDADPPAAYGWGLSYTPVSATRRRT